MTKVSAESCRNRARAVTAKADAARDYATMLVYDGLAREWLQLAALLEAEQDGFDPVDMHVGLRLRALRDEMGLSQAELGDRCGVPAGEIALYERGAKVISAGILWRLSQFLNLPVEHFYPKPFAR